jgi:hypothetical protein
MIRFVVSIFPTEAYVDDTRESPYYVVPRTSAGAVIMASTDE